MRLLGFESKQVLQRFGIATPALQLVVDPNGTPPDLELPVVLKAQVPVGGRGKAGGIIDASDPKAVFDGVGHLFGRKIRGYPVHAVLIENKAQVAAEYYLGVVYDTVAKSPLVLFSKAGGVDVEDHAKGNADDMAQRHFPIEKGFPAYQAREMLAAVGWTGRPLLTLAAIVEKLVKAFVACDATLAEINPLAQTAEGGFVALDCHMDIDDDAVFRQAAIREIVSRRSFMAEGAEKSEFVQKAEEIDNLDHRGVAGRMIEFDGPLGLIIGGGGASLTAFDAVRDLKGRPANYCEIGGNPSVKKVAELTKLILNKPGVEKIAVITNVVSNTRVDLVARGIIKGILACGRDPESTIAVFRIPGSWEEEGQMILKRYGVAFSGRHVSIDQAAQIAVDSM